MFWVAQIRVAGLSMDGLKRIKKEATIIYFQVPSGNLLEGMKTIKNLGQDNRFQPNICEFHVRNENHEKIPRLTLESGFSQISDIRNTPTATCHINTKR
jgi:hypothetical protein